MTAIEFQTQVVNLQDNLRESALKFTRDTDDVNDLVQETVLKALSNRSKFSDPTNLRGWLFTIMRNTFINKYRKAQSDNTFVDQTDEGYYINMADNYRFPQPDSEYSHKELLLAVEQVGENLRQPFKMHTIGYKYREIADELGMPVGTVKSRIFQARQELKRQYSN